jgi:hypothetical protein
MMEGPVQHYELVAAFTSAASSSCDNFMRAICTYRRCEFGRLGGLPALLTNWRKRRAHGWDIVRGEAAMQLAAYVV